jgi:hypothetical protein
MSREDPFPLKIISLWSLLIMVGIILSYFIFISLISINVGLSNIHQDGFWIPITAGIVVITGCLFFFLFSFKFLINRLREKDSISL